MPATANRGGFLLGVCLPLFAGLAAASGRSSAESGLPSLVTANTGFGFQLYGQLRTNQNNLALSPYSLSCALAMTSAGAQGQTARQIERAMQLPPGFTNLHSLFGALNRAILAVRQTNAVELSLASSLWPQKHYLVRPNFISLLETNYHAPVSPLDFERGGEKARLTLNAWVAEHTHERITNLFAPGALGRDTRLVLLNTVYFKGLWASPFDAAVTRAGKFHAETRASLDAAFMHQTARFGYLENRQFQLLAMPYAGRKVEMLLLLPRKPDGLGAIEMSLTAAKLAGWTGELQAREVAVTVPKLKLSAGYLLNTNLMALGMKDAFDPEKANFAGVDGGTHWLFVSQIRHQVFVEIDETGTEAAAATGVGMEKSEGPRRVPHFVADHPFLFLIRETATGSILFLGRVMDPGP